MAYDYVDLANKSVQKLRAAGSSMTFSGDIPFWYESITITYNNVTEELYKHIIDQMDYITIMDYRDYANGSDGIIANAQNEINYSGTVNKQVIIGVETTDQSPQYVTFYHDGENYMNEQLAIVDSYYLGYLGYSGLAIHDYTGYKSLTWGPRP